MSQASLPIPGRSALLQLHLGEYSSCLEAVYAHDHAIIFVNNNNNWNVYTSKVYE